MVARAPEMYITREAHIMHNVQIMFRCAIRRRSEQCIK